MCLPLSWRPKAGESKVAAANPQHTEAGIFFGWGRRVSLTFIISFVTFYPSSLNMIFEQHLEFCEFKLKKLERFWEKLVLSMSRKNDSMKLIFIVDAKSIMIKKSRFSVIFFSWLKKYLHSLLLFLSKLKFPTDHGSELNVTSLYMHVFTSKGEREKHCKMNSEYEKCYYRDLQLRPTD